MRFNLSQWKFNHSMPFFIIRLENPYARLFTNWVWSPKKGYFGFLACNSDY